MLMVTYFNHSFSYAPTKSVKLHNTFAEVYHIIVVLHYLLIMKSHKCHEFFIISKCSQSKWRISFYHYLIIQIFSYKVDTFMHIVRGFYQSRFIIHHTVQHDFSDQPSTCFQVNFNTLNSNMPCKMLFFEPLQPQTIRRELAIFWGVLCQLISSF